MVAALIREALASYRARIEQELPGRVRRVVLFGSHARGEAGEDSDVDVFVLLDRAFHALARSCSVATSWFCQDPGFACASHRPPLGSACTMENMTCDYGSCTVEGGTAVSCKNGVWQQAFVGCPL